VDQAPVNANSFDIREADYNDALTPLQNAYVYWRQLGFSPMQSAKKASYADPKDAARTNEANTIVRDMVTKGQEKLRVKHNIDRHHVIEGMLEALAVAREQSDPKVMLNAWSEIARVTGTAAPEVKEVNVKGDITHHQIHEASDRDLMKLLGKTRVIDVLEGDYERVEDDEVEDDGRDDTPESPAG